MRKPEVLAVVLLKIIIFWDQTVCQYGSSWHSEKQQCLHIHDQAVQEEQPRKETEARVGSQDIFIRLHAARHPNQWLKVPVFTLSVTQHLYPHTPRSLITHPSQPICHEPTQCILGITLTGSPSTLSSCHLINT